MEKDGIYFGDKPIDNREYSKPVDNREHFKPIDNIEAYGRGLEAREDQITDFGKGIYFYTCDGKRLESLEDVMQYNQIYYEMSKKREENYEKKGRSM